MKTTMKLFSTAFLATFVFLTACKGPQGDPGPAGANGTNGTNGKDGNANVIQVTFNQAFTPTTAGRVFTFPSAITTDILNASGVLVYVQNAANTTLLYQIPGLVFNDDFRYYTNPSTRQLTVIRASGTSITSISLVKAIIIPSNNNINGRKALPNIDFSDYEAVKKYYNLPD